MPVIVGPYQRIIGFSWPGGEPPGPQPGDMRWVTSFNASVYSGQIVTEPYKPAAYAWSVPNGIKLYEYKVPAGSTTGALQWVLVVEYDTTYAQVYGGNGTIGDTYTPTPNQNEVVIGMATTNEEILAGATQRISYEGEPGVFWGKNWSGTNCDLKAFKRIFDYPTFTTTIEDEGTQTCDFTVFYKNFSGRKYVPAGFQFMGLAFDLSGNPLPSMTWVDAGPFVS